MDCTLTEVFFNLTEVFLTLTEVFPCFFLRCKASARVKFPKTGHGPHSFTLVVICVVRLFVLFYVLFVCKCVLPPGDNPTAVNKYTIIINPRLLPICHLNCVFPCLSSWQHLLQQAYRPWEQQCETAIQRAYTCVLVHLTTLYQIFYIFLNVHLRIILVSDQLDAQFLL